MVAAYVTCSDDMTKEIAVAFNESVAYVFRLHNKSRLTWKGYYGGRRGAETEMNRYTNGNAHITSHHFGHTKAVADAHYIKPIPEETKAAALALDCAIGDSAETSRTGR